MRKVAFLSGTILSILFILTVPGCTYKDAIRIGVNDWPPCEVWYIAQEHGFFQDVEVELIRYSTWFDNMNNFYKGNSDITHATYFNVLYFHNRGQSARIILNKDYNLESDGLVIKKDIHLPDGLRGKRVGVEVNTDEHFILTKALDAYGLKEDDIIVVPTTSKQAMDLFIAGDVSAAVTYNPYLEKAEKEGDGKIVWTTNHTPEHIVDVLMASETLLEHRESDVRKIIGAWYDALDYIREHPDEAYQLMGKNEGMDAEAFGRFFESFYFYTLEENREIFRSSSFVDILEEINTFLQIHKVNIDELIPTEVKMRRLLPE